MAAVMGLSPEQIEELIAKAAGGRVLEAANYNCPGQIVLSGDKDAISDAEAPANELGATNFVRLQVSGPFHSSLMRPAAEAFLPYLSAIGFLEGHARVVSNVSAEWHSAEQTVDLLQKQIYSSVRWEASVRFLVAQGYTSFIEVGSGKVLRGLLRRIDKALVCQGSGDLESLGKILSERAG